MKNLVAESGLASQIDKFDAAKFGASQESPSQRSWHIFATAEPANDEGFWQYAQSLKVGCGPRLTLISVNVDWTALAEATQVGATSYINAQSSVTEHREAVRTILEGRTYFPFADVKQPGASCAASVPRLTQRQQNVLLRLRLGETNAEISRSLGISENTVRLHVSAILKAFGASNRTAVVVAAQGAPIGRALAAPHASS